MATCSPEDQREDGEEEDESDSKGEEVATTRKRLISVFVFKETFFFNGGIFLEGDSRGVVVWRDLAGGGGVTRVGRGGGGAEGDGCGVEGGGGFLAVLRWALDEVDEPSR